MTFQHFFRRFLAANHRFVPIRCIEFDLSRDLLGSLPFGVFDGLDELQLLHKDRIESLDEELFSGGNAKMHTLTLLDDALTELPAAVLRLPRIKRMDFSNNLIFARFYSTEQKRPKNLEVPDIADRTVQRIYVPTDVLNMDLSDVREGSSPQSWINLAIQQCSNKLFAESAEAIWMASSNNLANFTKSRGFSARNYTAKFHVIKYLNRNHPSAPRLSNYWDTILLAHDYAYDDILDEEDAKNALMTAITFADLLFRMNAENTFVLEDFVAYARQFLRTKEYFDRCFHFQDNK